MTPLDLLKIKKPEIRALHLTWIAFFICFYTWFNMAPLATTMARALGWLTPDDLSLLAICNVALTIPARIFIGMAIDRWGPRKVFSALMITMSLPVFLFAFGNNFLQFLISRLLLGCVGAGFVVGVQMTSLWFHPKDIGFASGVYAGWGNFGSAIAAMTLPPMALYLFGEENGWRYAIATSGVIILLYGLYYRWAITDGPVGTVVRKPRKVASIEVSCRADLIKLILWTIPVMGTSAILIWKIHRMGYLNSSVSAIAYGIIALVVFYQVAQTLRVNLPILKRGIPEDDRYPFNSVIALTVTYFADFGGGLAVISMLPAFFEETFHLTPTSAGLVASSFGFVNFFARPFGGILSDRMGSRKGVLQVYMLGMTMGFVLMGMMNDRWSVMIAVIVTVFCALFVHGSSGATFSILPLIKRRLTGQISGMVGAYGNIGALIYLTLYSMVDSQTFFFIVASGAFISFLACRFFLQEPQVGEYYLSSVDRDIEGENLLRNISLDTGEISDDSREAGGEQIKMKVAYEER